MNGRSWLLALAMLALQAGCLDASRDPPTDPGNTSTGPASTPSSTLSPPPLASQGTWFLQACHQVFFYAPQEMESGSQDLPPDHELSGGVYATLGLLVADCESSVRGNRSVVQGFRFAMTYQLLRSMGNETGTVDQDWYVRELVLEDEEAARDLAAFGFPAVLGEVALEFGPAGPAATVTAPGLAYTASGHQSQ